MNTPINRAQVMQDILPGLSKLFGMEYAKYTQAATRIEYVKKFSYGKYSIYKYILVHGQRQSSETLAKGLDKDEADGFLKLLKGNEE